MKSKEELEKSPAYWKEKAENWKWRYDQLIESNKEENTPKEQPTEEAKLRNWHTTNENQFQCTECKYWNWVKFPQPPPLSKEISEEEIKKLHRIIADNMSAHWNDLSVHKTLEEILSSLTKKIDTNNK